MSVVEGRRCPRSRGVCFYSIPLKEIDEAATRPAPARRLRNPNAAVTQRPSPTRPPNTQLKIKVSAAEKKRLLKELEKITARLRLLRRSGLERVLEMRLRFAESAGTRSTGEPNRDATRKNVRRSRNGSIC